MKRVLVCGANSTLLSVRAEVLRHASFQADIALGFDGMKSYTAGQLPDLFVICSSLPFDQRLQANQWTTAEHPDVPVIVITRRADEEQTLHGEVLPMETGPAGLVEAARRLTSSAQK
jgi:DNA-binding response OmpR family regulator